MVKWRDNILAYTDRTYKYKIKPPLTSWFLKKVTGLHKLSKMPGHIEVGKISIQYIYEIAKIKQSLDEDLSKKSLEDISKVSNFF